MVAVISFSLEDSACGYYKHKARFKIRLRMVLFCIIVLILNVGCLAKVLAHAVPRSLKSSDPQFLNSSIPQFLNSSFPPFLSSSLRQFTSSSIPEVLNSLVHQQLAIIGKRSQATSKQPAVKNPPYGCNRNRSRIKYNTHRCTLLLIVLIADTRCLAKLLAHGHTSCVF